MRALVIDNRDYVQSIIQNCLKKRLGWQVLSARAIDDGLQLAKLEQPDFILLTASLIDGEAENSPNLLQLLPLAQAVPVILLTDRARLRDELQWQELGIAAVIAQPFDPTLLPGQIAAILDRKSSIKS